MVDNGERGVRDLLGSRETRRYVRRNLVHYKNRPPQSPIHEQSRLNVLQWKLDIQHYDAIIEHVPGVMNTPADSFSRLVEKEIRLDFMILTCSATQWDVIRRRHEWLSSHNGVDKTLALMTQRHPTETSATQWPQLRHDVREYI